MSRACLVHAIEVSPRAGRLCAARERAFVRFMRRSDAVLEAFSSAAYPRLHQLTAEAAELHERLCRVLDECSTPTGRADSPLGPARRGGPPVAAPPMP